MEMEKAGLPTPAVNQIELNAYWRLDEIVNYCTAKGIAPMGYCPLFRGRKNDDPVLVEMARRYIVQFKSLELLSVIIISSGT